MHPVFLINLRDLMILDNNNDALKYSPKYKNNKNVTNRYYSRYLTVLFFFFYELSLFVFPSKFLMIAEISHKKINIKNKREINPNVPTIIFFTKHFP